MSFFLVSPGEALLLGRCLEEYLQARQGNPQCCFLDSISCGLDPFVPSMRVKKYNRVEAHDLPNDIDWDLLGDDATGYSATNPNAIYVEDDDHFVRTEWDESRSSLVHLLVRYLDGSVGKSPFDELWYPAKDDIDFPRRLYGLYQRLQETKEDERLGLSQKSPPDDEKAIEKAILALMSHNDCLNSFKTGRIFGGLLADCQRYDLLILEGFLFEPGIRAILAEDYGVFLGDDRISSPEQFFVRYRNHLDQLLATAELRACPYATSILEWSSGSKRRCSQILPRCGDVGYSHQDQVKLSEVRMAIWLAFGEVLGTLHGADKEARIKDASLPTPRAFRLTKDSAIERVGGQIYMVEQAINQPRGVDMLPEAIVDSLFAAVEISVKKVWGRDFESAGPNASVDQILREKQHRLPAGVEKRFADLALFLYKTYRNPAAHDPKFRCTFDEARNFLNGVRVLYEMSKTLLKQGRAE